MIDTTNAKWDFLIGYIERKEKISDNFAFMYSE